MDKVTFTLNGIRKHYPCGLERGSGEGYDLLRKNLGKGYGNNTPITIRQIYESNGHDDVLWCLRASDPKFYPLWRHFAVDCAKQVEHLMEDESSRNALVVARRHADGLATDEELDAALDVSGAASGTVSGAAAAAAWADADAAWFAARVAALVVVAVGDAGDAQIRLLELYCREGKRPENSVELLAQFIKEETNG